MRSPGASGSDVTDHCCADSLCWFREAGGTAPLGAMIDILTAKPPPLRSGLRGCRGEKAEATGRLAWVDILISPPLRA